MSVQVLHPIYSVPSMYTCWTYGNRSVTIYGPKDCHKGLIPPFQRFSELHGAKRAVLVTYILRVSNPGGIEHNIIVPPLDDGSSVTPIYDGIVHAKPRLTKDNIIPL